MLYTYMNICISITIWINYIRKIPLIRPGRNYRQRTNLVGLYSGGANIWEKKHFNLQSVKIISFPSFSHYKARILAYFTSHKM